MMASQPRHKGDQIEMKPKDLRFILGVHFHISCLLHLQHPPYLSLLLQPHKANKRGYHSGQEQYRLSAKVSQNVGSITYSAFHDLMGKLQYICFRISTRHCIYNCKLVFVSWHVVWYTYLIKLYQGVLLLPFKLCNLPQRTATCYDN